MNNALDGLGRYENFDNFCGLPEFFMRGPDVASRRKFTNRCPIHALNGADYIAHLAQSIGPRGDQSYLDVVNSKNHVEISTSLPNVLTSLICTDKSRNVGVNFDRTDQLNGVMIGTYQGTETVTKK